MARFPLAQWRGDIPNRTPGGMRQPYMGVVLHIMQGSLVGTDGWFHNPRAQASSTFGTGKNGTIYQWVDTADKAWAQVYGNPNWFSIENEGFAGQELTPQQLEANAQILAWLHVTHGIPMQVTDSVNVPGLGWHGMGGAAWGSHYGCPGDPVKNQRNWIVSRAKAIVQPNIPMPGGTVHYDPSVILEPIVSSWVPPEGGVLQLAPSGAVYAWGSAVFRGGANGKSYFAGRVAHHLEASQLAGKTYCIVDTANERYDY